MKIEKIKTILLTCLMILLYCGIFTKVKGADRIYFYGKLQNGKNIYYWINQYCQYTVAIPQAVKKLRCPKGMWNPIVLNRTTNKPSSKMDLYQYNFWDGRNAYTEVYRAKTNGHENILTRAEMDQMDWLYGKIYINDFNMDKFYADLRSTIILHEMCHVYGGRDVYDRTDTIMYGKTSVVRGMTRDFNDVLINKYK